MEKINNSMEMTKSYPANVAQFSKSHNQKNQINFFTIDDFKFTETLHKEQDLYSRFRLVALRYKLTKPNAMISRTLLAANSSSKLSTPSNGIHMNSEYFEMI